MFSSCSHSNGVASYVAPLSVRPITRSVRPVKSNDIAARRSLEHQFVDSFRAGKPAFDPYRRRPGYGSDVTNVDCQNVDRIGISFFLDKSELSAGMRNSKLTLYVRWLTPSNEESESMVDYYEGPAFYSMLPHKEYEDIYTAGLLFTHRKPYNGIYTVIVSYRGNELYRDSFNLVQCD